ncbi:MAG: tetratricopeptide repeat protein, partial [Anaerolineae bacterium]|nr:tetratricopeptide repeat protein [Anaerolineae bacterium]
MESPSAYIPLDRRLAIARGESLPEKTTGGALFADISGFTPLTEALLREYGPRRGAEELTQQLNLIYDALITEVHRYGGSVLAFSGDAITCWFDQDDGSRGAACGIKLQQVMGRFPDITLPSGDKIPLAMKVAVAAGPIRRFQLGDPKIQFIDTLAGATLDLMADAEHHANKGEVVVTASVMENAGHNIEVVEIRENSQTGQRFGVIEDAFADAVPVLQEEVWGSLKDEALPEELVRPWVLPPIYERLQSRQGQFLAELRPAVVLFLYFSGIDYDTDPIAGDKLDSYIKWVQRVLAQYEAYPFQLTIGDKGSYLYTAFGTPIAHEDDAIRAVSAALELRALPGDLKFINDLQIGISQGQLYAGAYGGNSRRTYGVMGDEVNLSARLMQAAGPNNILVSLAVQQNTGDLFTWEQLPPFKVKGKSQPIVAFNVLGRKAQSSIHLQNPSYALPMVGRQAELKRAKETIEQVLAGQGQFMGITAEAGMGKSRLVAEISSYAIEQGFVGYGGECPSYGTNISYLVWQPIWRSLFKVDAGWPIEKQIAHLETELSQINPGLASRLPLLGAVLNLPIPDNDLTQAFDAKLRKTSLESLLVDCLRAYAGHNPLFLVIEDSHWIDSLSMELLEVIGNAIVDLPVLVVMAYRPPELQELRLPWSALFPSFTEIELVDFTPDEAEQLIRLKLEHFARDHGKIPAQFIRRITERAQGNPFYIEELLNFLQDQDIDPDDREALATLELPASLHSLILSRIDQLTDSQKITLKVASVVGRLFQTAILSGVYPELGEPQQIRSNLETLTHLELTTLDKPEPELTYLFKHIVTQEVAYESLPYATRAQLHEQLAWFLEHIYKDSLEQYIEILAFHYARSNNVPKKREYLRKAGEEAQAEYANEAAIAYYEQVLPLLSPEDQIEVMLKLGEVLQLVGEWEKTAALYDKATRQAQQLDNREALAWCELAKGELLRKQGKYEESLTWFNRAREAFEAIGNQAGIGQVLHSSGTLAAQQGDYDAARTRYEASLEIRRALDEKPQIASLLSNLAILAEYQGDYAQAQALNEEGLATRQEVGDKWGIAISLNNLGNVILGQGHP